MQTTIQLYTNEIGKQGCNIPNGWLLRAIAAPLGETQHTVGILPLDRKELALHNTVTNVSTSQNRKIIPSSLMHMGTMSFAG